MLGYEGMAPVRQYVRWYEQMLQEQRPQGGECDANTEEDSPSFARQATMKIIKPSYSQDLSFCTGAFQEGMSLSGATAR